LALQQVGLPVLMQIKEGFVASINKPQANVTGISFLAEEPGPRGLLRVLTSNAITGGVLLQADGVGGS
jgi:hypothetical protein